MNLQAQNADGNLAQPLFRMKLWLFVALGLLVAGPYFVIERHVMFPVTVIPLSFIDRALPFLPGVIGIYLSLYLLLTLPLVLARNFPELRQMAFGFAWIAVASHILFFFWPTAIPAPAYGTQASGPLWRMALAFDTNGNACPSLHASLAVYCALCCMRLLQSRKLKTALWLWTLLILASTLLAKRHAFIDIFAGSVLASAAYVALFRRRSSEVAHSEALQATLRARTDLTRGLGADLVPLSRHHGGKRASEFLFFVALALAGVWVTVTSWTASRWFLMPVGIVATALALNAFVLLLHEGMHSTLFPSRRWNRFGAVLLGSTFLMSFSAYRVLHIRHHNYLGDPRDPDDYHNYIGHPLLLWSLHFVRLTVGSLLYLALIPVLALKYGSDRERRDVLAEYLFLLAVYSLALRFIPGTLLLVAWFVPLLIVGTLTAIRGFTQHGITDATDPYIASRTILPHPVVGFFLLHENYHLEHHLFPEVPSYHLPRLHRLVWPRLPRAVSGRSYLGFLARFLRATPQMDETPIGLEKPATKYM